MRRVAFVLLMYAGMISMPAIQLAKTIPSAQVVVTAAQVNGTWRTKEGEFKIWALGQQKLRVEFLGFYEFKSPAGPMIHTGEARGTATIEGDTAIFKPVDSPDDCKITMKFAKRRLIVKQEGQCGFGVNVTSAGTYRRASAAKPKFTAN